LYSIISIGTLLGQLGPRYYKFGCC